MEEQNEELQARESNQRFEVLGPPQIEPLDMATLLKLQAKPKREIRMGPGPKPPVAVPSKPKDEVHLCAYCSEPVDMIRGLLGNDYKQLHVCTCYVHMKCLGISKGVIACANCVCQVCDTSGKFAQSLGIRDMYEVIMCYPEKIFECGCKYHRPCYESLVKKGGPLQIRGIEDTGFTKCYMCLPSAFALDPHPLVLGPNYFKTNKARELAIFRDGFPDDIEVKAQQPDPNAERHFVVAKPVKTLEPPPMTARQLVKLGPIVPIGLISTESVESRRVVRGHRLYCSRLNIVELVNAGFTLQDFARHLTPAQFFRRFFSVQIITEYLPATPDSQFPFGCKGDTLFHAWPQGVSMDDLFGGIKGLLTGPPTDGQASSPSTRIGISDLTALRVTAENMASRGLKIQHVMIAEPLILWREIYPDLQVTKLAGWQEHHVALLAAELITQEQATEAINSLHQQRISTRVFTALSAYIPDHLQRSSIPVSAPQQEEEKPTLIRPVQPFSAPAGRNRQDPVSNPWARNKNPGRITPLDLKKTFH